MIAEVKFKSHVFVFILTALFFYGYAEWNRVYISCKISKELADICTTGFILLHLLFIS